MYLSSNNIVTLTQPAEHGKLYTHHCDGIILTDYDHKLFVYHKRHFKIINRKDLGKKMSIIYAKNNTRTPSFTLQEDVIKRILTRYQGFDEQKGQKYYFLHQVNHSEIQGRNQETKNILQIQYFQNNNQQLRNTENRSQYERPPEYHIPNIITILFTASHLYGKRNTRIIDKQTHLRSITIQFQVIYQNTYLIQYWEQLHQTLQKQGFFNTFSCTENESGYIIQYTIHDEEILEYITSFCIAKDYHITKRSSTEKLSHEFLFFCEQHGYDTSLLNNQKFKFIQKK